MALPVMRYVYAFGDLCPDHHSALASRILYLLYLLQRLRQHQEGRARRG